MGIGDGFEAPKEERIRTENAHVLFCIKDGGRYITIFQYEGGGPVFAVRTQTAQSSVILSIRNFRELYEAGKIPKAVENAVKELLREELEEDAELLTDTWDFLIELESAGHIIRRDVNRMIDRGIELVEQRRKRLQKEAAEENVHFAVKSRSYKSDVLAAIKSTVKSRKEKRGQ